MIKLTGATQTRTFRTLWMLEELGLDYEHNPVSSKDTHTPEHLALNPNGHVPVLEDDGLTLVESMAINLYLAQKYDKGLWPKSLEEQAQATQWSFWVMLETETDLMTALFNRLLAPEDQRDETRAIKAEKRLQGPLKVIDAALEGREVLVGDSFSVADLNVAAVLSWTRGAGISLDAFPDLARWYGECFSRPARKTASKK